MLSGDDLAISLFFVGTSISIALAAMTAAGWRHPILIRSLFGLALGIFVIGIAWPAFKTVSPPITAIVTQLATNPFSWFMILMLGVATVLMPGRRNGRFWNAKASLETQPTIALIDREHTYLFPAPPNRELWKANVRLSRSCEKLQIRLDYKFFSGGVGRGYWSHRNQLLLKGERSYANGQDIDVDLMCVDNSLWHWKIANGDELPLVSQTENQCRLVFIANGHIADDFAFLVIFNESTKPKLIGENNFSFARKWREEE